jgi:hypothetical protein
LNRGGPRHARLASGLQSEGESRLGLVKARLRGKSINVRFPEVKLSQDRMPVEPFGRNIS